MSEFLEHSPADQALQLNGVVNSFEDTLPDGVVDDVVAASEWYRLRVAQQTALVTEGLERAGVTDEGALDVVRAGIEKAVNEGFRVGRRVDQGLPEMTIRTGHTFSETDPQPRSVDQIVQDFS